MDAIKTGLAELQSMIYEIRGQKVMFDRDLAALYEVEVKVLNQAVKRHIERFPPDFMFQLTQEEWEILMFQIGTSRWATQDETGNLKSQFVTSSWGGVRKIPHVFTEQGIAMLSGLLNSEVAVKVNIDIMRAFVKLRHYVLGKPDTSEQIAELRKLLMLYIDKNDKCVNDIILALNSLLEQPPKQSKQIGFNPGEK